MADQESINIPLPIGRLVRGSLTERATHNYDGDAYEEGKGPFELALAVRKDDPAAGQALVKLYTHAKAGYASNAAVSQRIDAEWSSGFTLGSFRFKVRDGDKPNQEGQINQNTVGHYVLYLSSYINFKATYTNAHGLPKFKTAMGVDIEPGQEIERSNIKIGDYVYMAVGTKSNGKLDQTAGMYLNINGVMLAARGEAITGGISLQDAFADVQFAAALPPGASVSAPVAGLPVVASAAPVTGLPVQANAPAGVPLPGTVAPGSVQPHTAFLAGPVSGAAPGGGLPLPGQG